MIRLIKTECLKIFHKKSLFIIWTIMFIFCFLNNLLYYMDYDQEGNYKYLETENLDEQKQQLQKELKQYNLANESDIPMYLSIKTKLNIIALKEKYPPSSWQYRKMNDYCYDLCYQINYLNLKKEKEELAKKELQYQQVLKQLKNDNWEYFIKQERATLITANQRLTEQLKEIITLEQKLELKKQIKQNQDSIQLLNYRLQNHIKEDNGYLNQAFLGWIEQKQTITNYQTLNRKLTFEEQKLYQQTLANEAINKYIVSKKININKQNTLNYNLRTITEDYEFFIIILIFLIVSIIICEEFQTGTIKLLLIKPYSRGKILLSKYIASILITLLSIAFLVLTQFALGSIFFGIEDLSIPVIVYHYTLNSVKEYPVILYMIIRIIARLPFFFMFLTITFSIGILTTNTILTIALPLILYLFQPYFCQLAIQYHITYFRFLITFNWRFEDYLFGGTSTIPYVNKNTSLIIWIIYFLIISLITFFSFKKRNIKNI